MKSFQGSDISTNIPLQKKILQRTGINPTAEPEAPTEPGTFTLFVSNGNNGLVENHFYCVFRDWQNNLNFIDLSTSGIGGISS